MMKKIGLLITLSVFIASSVIAQGKPSFGIKAGVNFVNVDSSNDVSLGNSSGSHAGLTLHVPFVKKSGLQVEAFYSAEGIDDIDLAYVSVPILYTYKIIPGLRLQVGPQFKVKVDADVSLRDGVDAEADNKALEEDFKDFNFDAALGLEYKFPIIGLFLQARSNFGLNDIGDDEFGKTMAIQLSAGYRF